MERLIFCTVNFDTFNIWFYFAGGDEELVDAFDASAASRGQGWGCPGNGFPFSCVHGCLHVRVCQVSSGMTFCHRFLPTTTHVSWNAFSIFQCVIECWYRFYNREVMMNCYGKVSTNRICENWKKQWWKKRICHLWHLLVFWKDKNDELFKYKLQIVILRMRARWMVMYQWYTALLQSNSNPCLCLPLLLNRSCTKSSWWASPTPVPKWKPRPVTSSCRSSPRGRHR